MTTPRRAARTFPTDSRLPARMARVRSAVKKDRTIPTTKTMRTSSSSTLGVSYRKKATASPRCDPRVRPSAPKLSHSASGWMSV